MAVVTSLVWMGGGGTEQEFILDVYIPLLIYPHKMLKL